MRKSARLLSLALRTTFSSTSVPLSEYSSSTFHGGSGHPRLLFRTLLSNSTEEEQGDTDDVLRDKLRKIAGVVQVQHDLKHESELHDSISKDRLLQLIQDRRAARDAKEAEDLILAMQRAGVVVLHNKRVFLNPADLVEYRLPDFPRAADLKAKLEQINGLLKPYEEIHREAERRAWRLLYWGCFAVAIQLAAFLRLTYYELSWDVMEPVGYMISLFYTLLGYSFFIYTRGHPFDLNPVKEWYKTRIKGEKATAHDEERYEALVKAQERYQKRLRFLQKLEDQRAS